VSVSWFPLAKEAEISVQPDVEPELIDGIDLDQETLF